MNISHSTVRAAALTGFGSLCRSYGIDAAIVLRSAGLPPQIERDPDRRIPARAVNIALEHAAELAGTDDFGLRLAAMRGIANLGPVTVLARDEPDVRSALAIFMAYLPLHNEALHIELQENADEVILSCAIDMGGPNVQASDIAVAMLHRILRQLLGPDWLPLMVCLDHPAPVRTMQFQRSFGCPVQFGQLFCGIVLRQKDLSRPNILAEAGLRPYTEGLRRNLEFQGADNLTLRIRQLLRAMLANRRCTAAHVAQQLGLSRRSLDRRLALEGTSFHTISNAVRGDIACGQILGSRRTMAEIGDLLGFSSPAAFNAWFTAQFGQSPARWRKVHRGSR